MGGGVMRRSPINHSLQARTETIRQAVIRWLEIEERSIGDLSKEIGNSEREIIAHLEQIAQTQALRIIPVECLRCGFIFRLRKRIKKPSKCPECKNTYLEEPLFSMKTD
jgi:predicted Zn-ribbon and HTH transcriptional regulator